MPDAVFHSRAARSATLKARAAWIAVGVLGGATMVGAAWRVLSPSSVPQVTLASRDSVPLPSLAAPVPQQDAPAPLPDPSSSERTGSTSATPAGSSRLAVDQQAIAAAAANAIPQHKPVEIIQQPGPARGVGEKINLNLATADQIALLPGIGPKLAASIVADRAKNGKYKRVADLDRVKGIGRKKIDAIRSSVTVD